MKLPQSLLDTLQGLPGYDAVSFLDTHEREDVLVSIRANPAKISDEALMEHFSTMLDKQGNPIQLSPVPWCEHSFYLSGRPSFTMDPLLHAGCYYVQEASSMLLAPILKQCLSLDHALCVLDLCAAPGGKSTLIQSMLSSESFLVSNEVIKSRANILEENLTKWGALNTVVVNNDPKDFKSLGGFFDCVVVDAPCSGSGLFRRDPEAVNEWSLHNVALCSQRQQRILSDILPALKEEGILVYSTCSFSPEEDEHIMEWLVVEMDMEPLVLSLEEAWGVQASASASGAIGYRCWPNKVKGEGFFIACFRKKTPSIAPMKVKKNTLPLAGKLDQQKLTAWVSAQMELQFVEQGGHYFALPASMVDNLFRIQQAKLYIKKAGISLGKIVGDSLLPDHALAMSTILNYTNLTVSLHCSDALQYLRREELPQETVIEGMHGRVSAGWALVKYADSVLGWLKVMPQRSNNYYPKEWRILKK